MAGDIEDQVMRLSEKALQIDFKATKITARLVMNLAKKALHQNGTKSGRQTVKQLQRKGSSVENVPVSAEDLRQLRRELRRYGVDYSIVKDRNTGVYSLFFKAQDASMIRTALEKCLGSATIGRKPMREVLANAQARAEQRQAQRAAERGERSDFHVDRHAQSRGAR